MIMGLYEVPKKKTPTKKPATRKRKTPAKKPATRKRKTPKRRGGSGKMYVAKSYKINGKKVQRWVQA
jgi:hypothetical protein